MVYIRYIVGEGDVGYSGLVVGWFEYEFIWIGCMLDMIRFGASAGDE